MARVQWLIRRGSDQNTAYSLLLPLLGGKVGVLQLAAVSASHSCQKEQQSPQTCCVSLCCSACGLCAAQGGDRLLITTSALLWEHLW